MIFAFTGIFVAGVVAGILVAPRFFHSVIQQQWQGGPRGSGRPPLQRGQPLGPQVFRQYTDQLDLTAEQQEKIKPIELRITETLRRLRRDAQHNTELALQEMQDEISKVLTPQQRTQFETRIAEGRERMKNRLKEEQEGRGRREGGSSNRPHEAPPK